VSADAVIARLRTFLLTLAVALCVGTVVELWLTDHLQTPLQFVPFVLCALGLAALIAVLLRPGRKTIWTLRAVMVVAALGALLGTYEHLEYNLEFAREINASKADAAPVWTALTGANPPLAPGVLGVTALIALAATYVHPALEQSNDERCTSEALK
jgi:hypothetical protein